MNNDDLEFIERFYADIERGYKSLGKEYTRPANYVERGLKVLYGKRNPVAYHTEGKRGAGFDSED